MSDRKDYYEHHDSEIYLMDQFQGDFTHCDSCDRSISFEDVTRFEEMFYCPDCAEVEGITPCSWCGTIHRVNGMETHDDGIYCNSTCYRESEGDL